MGETGTPTRGGSVPAPRRWRRRRRLIAIALIVLLVGAGWALPRLPNVHDIGAQLFLLESWTSQRPASAILILAAALFVSAAAAMPLGGTITAVGGFLLGGFVSGATAVIVAPLGALTLFAIVRRSFGERLRSRLSTRFEPFVREFQSDAVSYLICLRLMPTPFWLVNVSAAVLGARWRTFLWTTAIGIVPMTFAHAFAGAAVGHLMRARHTASQACAAGDSAGCASRLSFTDLIGPSTILAFAALGLLALLPVLLRKLKAPIPRLGS